jgi:hypothetical protein
MDPTQHLVLALSDEFWAGVIGAGVGGLATLAGTALQHWLTARRERRQEAGRASRETKTAARILWSDLEWAQRRVEAALQQRRYWSMSYSPWREESWFEYREILASALDADWPYIRDALRSVRTISLQAEAARTEAEPRPALNDPWGSEQLRIAHARISDALRRLALFAGDSPDETTVPQNDGDIARDVAESVE